jgi:hypothetical protein
LGISSSAASAMARSLAPFQSAEQGVTADQATPSWMREVRGTGAALLVAQLKDAGIEYVFCSPSSGAAPFYDALVDEPDTLWNRHNCLALKRSVKFSKFA